MNEEFMPIVFVCLGYIKGDYPKIKPRNDNRMILIEE